MIRRRTITSYVWDSVSGNKMVILLNCIRNFFRKFELTGNSMQGENPAPENPQEIKSAGRFDEASGKYLLDVKVTGRNILSDVKDMYNIFVPCPIKAGTTVTLITNGVESDGGNILFTTDSGEDYWYAIDKGKIKVATSINKNVIGFKNLLQKKDGLKYCLVIGDADNYEPYTEQTVQIALDEPLRGIGEYKDTITKDGVVRKILEAPLVKYLKPVINGNVGNRYVFAEVPNANINYDRERCMSNVGFTNSTEKKKYIPHPYQLNFLIRVADDDTIEMVKEKIKDMIVAYTVKEPITEPLPESVQQQLQALHSENGTTHVFVDSGEVEAGINIEYKYKS